MDLQGKSVGYDPEVAKLFADSLGVAIEHVPLAVANRIPSLTTGKVDILFASMAMTPERAKSVQYSKPYIANNISVLAEKNLSIKSEADVGKLSVGVPKASIQDNLVSKIAGAKVLRYDDDAATIQALLSGQVDAIGGNIFYINKLDQSSPGKFENKIELTSLYIGACTRLGEKEINASVNAFLDEIKANGELAGLYKKWMQQDLPTFPSSVPDVPFTVK
ncbi:transporter substrate-binding domain-containing protein [Agrobacterium cavarae]